MSNKTNLYRTTVYLNQSSVQWLERIIIHIPDRKKWKGLHLYLLFLNVRDSSREEAFAFAYLKLLNNELSNTCFIPNIFHSIPTYKYSNKDAGKNQNYLTKFDIEDSKWAASRRTPAICEINTILYSTITSCNISIAQILSWDNLAEYSLANALRKLAKIEIYDLFDYITPILNSLLSILISKTYNKSSNEVHELALSVFLSLCYKMIAESINLSNYEYLQKTQSKKRLRAATVISRTNIKKRLSLSSVSYDKFNTNNNLSNKNRVENELQNNNAIPTSVTSLNTIIPKRIIDYYVLPDFKNMMEYFISDIFNHSLIYNHILSLFSKFYKFVTNIDNDKDNIQANNKFNDYLNTSKIAGFLFRILYHSYTLAKIKNVKDDQSFNTTTIPSKELYNDFRYDIDQLFNLLHNIIASDKPLFLQRYMKGPLLNQFIIIYELCLKENIYDLDQIIKYIEIIIINSKNGCDISVEYSKYRLQFLINLVTYLLGSSNDKQSDNDDDDDEIMRGGDEHRTKKKKKKQEENNDEDELSSNINYSKYHTRYNCLHINFLKLDQCQNIRYCLYNAIIYHIQDDRSIDEKYLACKLLTLLIPSIHLLFNSNKDQYEMLQILNIIPLLTYFMYDIINAYKSNQLYEKITSLMDNKLLNNSALNIVKDVLIPFLSLLDHNILNKQRLTYILYTIRTISDINSEKIFINYILEIFIYLINHSIFNELYIILRMYELKLIYHFICWISTHLIQEFINDLNLWRNFGILSLDLLLSNTLNLDDFSKSKRKFIKAYYSDLRRPLALVFQMTWYYLGDLQLELLDITISKLIQLSQLNEDICLSLGKSLYFSLFSQEYMMKGNISSFLYHTIDAISILASKYKHNTKQLTLYINFFQQHLKDYLNQQSNTNLIKAGNKFVLDIQDIFQRLIKLESLPITNEYEVERSLQCISLLSYFLSLNKMDLYRKYAFYLAYMHYNLNNKIELAYTLLLLADSYPYNDKIELSVLNDYNPFQFPVQTASRRKIALMELAIQNFDDCMYWEQSVQIKKELSEAYEYILYQYPTLITSYQQSAEYWSKILNVERIYNAYYRVAFYGEGFNHLTCKEYVYRSGKGNQLESIRDFTLRIQAKYPLAYIENSSNLPQEKYLINGIEEKKQYIQITTLTCSNEEEYNHINQDQKNHNDDISIWYHTNGLPPNVLKYHSNNNINVWSYTRVDSNYKSKKKKKKIHQLMNIVIYGYIKHILKLI